MRRRVTFVVHQNISCFSCKPVTSSSSGRSKPPKSQSAETSLLAEYSCSESCQGIPYSCCISTGFFQKHVTLVISPLLARNSFPLRHTLSHPVAVVCASHDRCDSVTRQPLAQSMPPHIWSIIFAHLANTAHSIIDISAR